MMILSGVRPETRNEEKTYSIGKLSRISPFFVSVNSRVSPACLSSGFFIAKQKGSKPGALREYDLFGVDHQETKATSKMRPFKSRGYHGRNQHGVDKIGLSGDIDHGVTFHTQMPGNRFRTKRILELSGANYTL